MKTYLFTIAALFGAISAQDLLLLVQSPKSYQLQQLEQAKLIQGQVQQLQQLQTLQQLSKVIELQNLQIDGQMNKLPADAADMLKQAFLSKSWSIVEESRGLDNSRAESNWNSQWQSFKNIMDGWLEHDQFEIIQAMIYDKAYHAKNVRAQNWDDSKRDEANYHLHWDLLKHSGKFTASLVDDIMWLATYAAWHTAYAQDGPSTEGDYNFNRLNSKSAEMATDVTIKAMHFKPDQAMIGAVKPQVICQDVLINQTGETQNMTFKCSQTDGHTTSTSTTFNFPTKISESMKVGFEGLGASKFSTELNFEKGKSWQEALNGATKYQTFEILVPPYKKQQIQAVVQEATMEVPYELVLDFGGNTVTTTGTWKGVTSSEIQYNVFPIY